jgi:hypothetical protein
MVMVWNLSKATLQQTLPHDNEVIHAEFSADGAWILTSGPRIPTTLWDVQTGQAIRTFGVENIAVRGASLSPDGRLVATADLDGSLRLWDAQTGRQRRRVVGFKATLAVPNFSPDGRIIALTAENGSVFLVRTDINDLIAQTCSLLPRDLSEIDRERYRVTETTATCPQFVSEGGSALILPRPAAAQPVTVPPPAVVLPTPTPNPVPYKPVSLSNENRGELTTGQVQSWVYNGRAGQTLSIRASAEIRAYDLEDYFAGLDTLLVVFDSEGRVIAQNDDAADGSGDAEIILTLDRNGLYRIEVRSAGLSTGGAYSLDVTLVE